MERDTGCECLFSVDRGVDPAVLRLYQYRVEHGANDATVEEICLFKRGEVTFLNKTHSILFPCV
jgi:hypothetical protein